MNNIIPFVDLAEFLSYDEKPELARQSYACFKECMDVGHQKKLFRYCNRQIFNERLNKIGLKK